MHSILYISVAVIAIAFCVLVIYIIQTMKALKTTLDRISHTVDSLEGQLQGITKETESLLQKTNDLAADLQQKSKRLDSVVIAAEEIGNTIQTLNTSINHISNKVISKVSENQGKISQIAGWGKIAVELKDKWDEIRNRRKHKQVAIDKRTE